MKKMYLIIVEILILSAFLVGCNNIDSSKVRTSTHTEAKTTPKSNATLNNSTTGTSTEVEKNSSSNTSTTNNSTIAKKENIIYKNLKLGFTMEFPTSWKGHFVIKNGDTDYIEVHFIGKSKISKGDEGNGLFMFYIGTEAAFNDLFTDGKKKIGTANGTDYYYATGTDYPLSALDLTTDQYSNESVSDEKERKLMGEDFAKAKEMEKDIQSILKTFKTN